jgi:hypothetical protein
MYAADCLCWASPEHPLKGRQLMALSSTSSERQFYERL